MFIVVVFSVILCIQKQKLKQKKIEQKPQQTQTTKAPANPIKNPKFQSSNGKENPKREGENVDHLGLYHVYNNMAAIMAAREVRMLVMVVVMVVAIAVVVVRW